MSLERTTMRKTAGPIEHTSCDAPPLDFSFRNINALECKYHVNQSY
jgi:hypothetical protein